MKRLVYSLIIPAMLGLLIACGTDDSATPPNEKFCIKESTYLTKFDHDSSIPDSIRKTIHHLAEKEMRWWGIDTYNNNPDSLMRHLQRRRDTLDLAFTWTQKHRSNDLLMGKMWNQKGLYYVDTHQFDSAFYCFHKAYDLFTKSQCYAALSTTTLNIAGIHYRIGNITTAAKYYKRASLLADSLDNDINCMSIHIALAQIYADLKNFTLAHHHLDQAELMFSTATLYELYFYYFARGTCFYYQKENAKAYATFTLALECANKIGLFQQIMCQSSLAETALLNNNPEVSLSHLKPCLEILEKRPNMIYKTVKFYLCSIASDVFLSIGDIPTARKYIDMLPEDKDVKMLRYLSLHYSRISTHAEKVKNYEVAYKYLQIAQKYQEQINSENAINNIIEIGQRYQRDTTTLRQNVTIANIEKQMSQHHLQLTIIIGGLLLVLSGCIIMIVMIRRRNERLYNAQINQILKLRMDVVRNRISPHYVFNVLGMMLPKFKSNPELHQLSELFIDVIRGNLMASSQLCIRFDEEIRLVKQYVSLYHKTTSPYPIVNWHDATNGEANSVMVPTMCVQIPMENALKHAFSELNENCKIDVFVIVENERLILSIIDNGDGFNPGRVPSTGRDTGTGLRVLSRTITLFNKQNSHHIEIHIKNLTKRNNKGTEVKISIPFDFQYTR